jgi:hypothetical protein
MPSAMAWWGNDPVRSPGPGADDSAASHMKDQLGVDTCAWLVRPPRAHAP